MQTKLYHILNDPFTLTFHFQHLAFVLLGVLVIFGAGYFYGIYRALQRKGERHFEFEET